jgi:type II secretory pathway component PulF
LVYAFGKLFHLPALVTIFIFGIFLSNVKSLLPNFLKTYLDLDQTEKELHEFHILTAESTFIVRTFFFLFFGFSIQLTDFNSPTPSLWYPNNCNHVDSTLSIFYSYYLKIQTQLFGVYVTERVD